MHRTVTVMAQCGPMLYSAFRHVLPAVLGKNIALTVGCLQSRRLTVIKLLKRFFADRLTTSVVCIVSKQQYITMNAVYLPSVCYGPSSPAIFCVKIYTNDVCVNLGLPAQKYNLMLEASEHHGCFKRNFRFCWSNTPSLLKTTKY